MGTTTVTAHDHNHIMTTGTTMARQRLLRSTAIFLRLPVSDF
ncbi:hypothetical protein ACLG6S_13810 [Thermodesulfobacteriota bacterium B35]